MASMSIRFGRGKITRTTKTVNRHFDPTEVETITLELNTGMALREVSMFATTVYDIDGDRVSEETFLAVLKRAGHDWNALLKALYKQGERQSRFRDPMGCLEDYE